MGTTGRKAFVLVLGLLLAMGIPYPGPTAVQADPGCGCHAGKGHDGRCGKGCGKDCGHKASCGCGHREGCGCEHAYPKDAGQAGADCPCGMQDNTAGGHGGKHAMMGGKDAPPMKERMSNHLEEMRSVVKKLREIEAKMAGQLKDGESFRQLSLEHAKLLTDLQASHLRHMEGMMAGGK